MLTSSFAMINRCSLVLIYNADELFLFQENDLLVFMSKNDWAIY